MELLLILILLAIVFPMFTRGLLQVFGVIVLTVIFLGVLAGSGRAQSSTTNCYPVGNTVQCNNTYTPPRPPVGSPGWMDAPQPQPQQSRTICMRVGTTVQCRTNP
jgi:hypothetical protein